MSNDSTDKQATTLHIEICVPLKGMQFLAAVVAGIQQQVEVADYERSDHKRDTSLAKWYKHVIARIGAIEHRTPLDSDAEHIGYRLDVAGRAIRLLPEELRLWAASLGEVAICIHIRHFMLVGDVLEDLRRWTGLKITVEDLASMPLQQTVGVT